MGIARAVLLGQVAAVILSVGGVVVLAVGAYVHGKGGADLGRAGQLIAVLGAFRIGYLARSGRMRATYRYLRCRQQRTDRDLEELPCTEVVE